MLIPVEMSYRFPMHQLLLVEKYDAKKVIAAVHYLDSKKANFVKRFQIETTTADTKFLFIGEESKDKLVFVTTVSAPVISYTLYGAKKDDEPTTVDLEEFIDVKGWKSIGNKLETGTIRTIQLVATEETETEESGNNGMGDDDDDNNPNSNENAIDEEDEIQDDASLIEDSMEEDVIEEAEPELPIENDTIEEKIEETLPPKTTPNAEI